MKYLVCSLLLLSFFNGSWSQSADQVTFGESPTILSGTLSTPVGSGPFPAVVLISGSGPQDRDNNMYGFKSFKILADSLNAEGYAVLRYDDRSVGKSMGKEIMQSTSEELAEDVYQAVLFLRSRGDIDPKRIGLIGHSEGGILAPMVAARDPDVKAIVLMAGPGLKGSEIILSQQRAIMKSSGMSDEHIAASAQLNREIYAMIDKEPIEKIKEHIKQKTIEMIPLLPQATQDQIKDPESFAVMASLQAAAQINLPWLKYFLTYDPLPTLRKVKAPVLLLFGELDTQVLPEVNAEVMANALREAGNQQVSVVVLPKTNHLFQLANTGNPSEYAQLKPEFADGFMSSVTVWLNDNLK